ncbi:hypothetical protein ACSQ67_016388 [Phaseolus vulgaris]
MFTGNSPLVMLDLSYNEISGGIQDLIEDLSYSKLNFLLLKDSFSKLVQTESLDLSFNKLSGEIPSKLNILTSLEVFSVAHNNLSGPIPEWTNQFATFDESSYEGNPFLCGTPLSKSCHPAPTIIPNDLDFDKDNDRLMDMSMWGGSKARMWVIDDDHNRKIYLVLMREDSSLVQFRSAVERRQVYLIKDSYFLRIGHQLQRRNKDLATPPRMFTRQKPNLDPLYPPITSKDPSEEKDENDPTKESKKTSLTLKGERLTPHFNLVFGGEKE